MKKAFDLFERKTVVVSLAIVVTLSLAWALLALGRRPLDTHDTSWLWGDLAQVYLAWTQYGMDQAPHWLETDRLSYPVEMSVSLFDPMPIFLLAVSWISKLVPEGTQYFGYYFAACAGAQGVFGYLAAREATRAGLLAGSATDLWKEMSWIAAGICCAIAPFTLLRFTGHTALASQWVLLLSIWVALRWRSSGDLKWGMTHGGVMALSTGLNPYLALMVGLNFAFAQFVGRKAFKTWRPLIRVTFLAFVAVAGLSVFGFMSGAASGVGGYGIYSMNALGPFDSNGQASILSLNIPDPTGGQTFEGFQYLGLGVMGLMAISIFVLFRRGTRLSFLLPAAGVIAATYVLSLSLSPSFATMQANLPVPSIVIDALSRFRCTGRLFWIGSFWIIICSVAIISLRFQPRNAAIIISVLTIVQLVDVSGIALSVRHNLGTVQRMEPISPVNPLLAARYKAVVLLPPWQCDNQETPGGVRNYESVGYFAIGSGLATNNFYAGRTPEAQQAFHCNTENFQRLRKDDHIFIASEEFYSTYRTFFSGMICQRTLSEPVGIICFGNNGRDLIPASSDHDLDLIQPPRESYADRWSKAVSYDEDAVVYDYLCNNLKGQRCTPEILSNLQMRGLSDKPTLDELAYQFVLLQAEQATSSAIVSDEDFVVAAYQVLLGRAPDPAGLQAQLNSLKSTKDRLGTVGAGFMNSVEFKLKAPSVGSDRL